MGWFQDGTGKAHGFLKDGTTFTTIDVPGATETVARGINETGQIVGWFIDAMDGHTHGFLKDGTTFTTIDVPGATQTIASGINEAGQIVGWFIDARGEHGFVATPDTTPPLITISASPATLRPPNGQLVTVTVSGAITDEGSGVSRAGYTVMDEYDQVKPSGPVTLEADGSYAFTIQLQASRKGNDQNGRRYTITVSATDNAGNEGDVSAIVTVPHDQRR
jgi:probable HAF family extracellular repeat protein